MHSDSLHVPSFSMYQISRFSAKPRFWTVVAPFGPKMARASARGDITFAGSRKLHRKRLKWPPVMNRPVYSVWDTSDEKCTMNYELLRIQFIYISYNAKTDQIHGIATAKHNGLVA